MTVDGRFNLGGIGGCCDLQVIDSLFTGGGINDRWTALEVENTVFFGGGMSAP